MSPTIEPIAPWPLIAVFGLVILGLTLWAYARRLHGTSGGWRWVALGLRLAAVLMCLMAALKPSLLILRRDAQDAAIVFLLDDSTSMGISDEANSRSRFEAAQGLASRPTRALVASAPGPATGAATFADVEHHGHARPPQLLRQVRVVLRNRTAHRVHVSHHLNRHRIDLQHRGSPFESSPVPPPAERRRGQGRA